MSCWEKHIFTDYSWKTDSYGSIFETKNSFVLDSRLRKFHPLSWTQLFQSSKHQIPLPLFPLKWCLVNLLTFTLPPDFRRSVIFSTHPLIQYFPTNYRDDKYLFPPVIHSLRRLQLREKRAITSPPFSCTAFRFQPLSHTAQRAQTSLLSLSLSILPSLLSLSNINEYIQCLLDWDYYARHAS